MCSGVPGKARSMPSGFTEKPAFGWALNGCNLHRNGIAGPQCRKIGFFGRCVYQRQKPAKQAGSLLSQSLYLAVGSLLRIEGTGGRDKS